MQPEALRASIISSRQIIAMSHPLAAANHWQWAWWEEWVLRDPAKLVPSASGSIIDVARANGLDNVLQQNAKAVIDIVRREVGDFAYEPALDRVAKRKLEQFAGWVEYAVTKPADRERWLLQCRTPFLALAPDMQRSDYTEALKDLEGIADAGGLVLADPLPTMQPQTSMQLQWLRLQHKLGHHGRYVDSKEPWSNFCLGCHRRWSSH